ncbi:hypothetical protein WJX82_009358 [Trebouxia sp. C0006]
MREPEEDREQRLQQANGPGIVGRPVSATSADLVNDPTGRAHLLAALGNPEAYVGNFPYEFAAGTYNIDPSLDPAASNPTANASGVGSWRVVGNSGSIAVHALPFTNDLLLLMARPNNEEGDQDTALTNYLTVDNGTQTEVAALYNMTDNTFVPFHIPESPFCSGHTLLPDGRGLVIGGDIININGDFLKVGFQAVRVFDPTNQTITTVGYTDRGRWYPTVMTLADGNILVVGGVQMEAGGWATKPSASSSMHATPECSPNLGGSMADPYYDNPTYSVIDSTTLEQSPSLTLTILLEAWPINSYPYATQLPSGSVLIIAGAQMEAMYIGATGATADNSIGILPQLPVPVNYPQYNSLALLPVDYANNYSASVLLAGGSSEYCAASMSPAGTHSFLVDVTPGANHTVVMEDLAQPRVMGDLTLLPDGTVFLCNGAQIGIAGGAGPNRSDANIGTTIGEIYDPKQPIGQRWTTVADSQIWRLYHSVAFLTSNAEVLVAGSEVTAEHRVQLYTPAYLQNGRPRPVITSVSSKSVTYSQNISVSFSNVTSVDRAVLNRYTGATHGVASSG